jgi:hypothetical protein
MNPPWIDISRLYYERYMYKPKVDIGPINFYTLTARELFGDLIALDENDQVIRGGLERRIQDLVPDYNSFPYRN